jgi:hypothetical protein
MVTKAEREAIEQSADTIAEVTDPDKISPAKPKFQPDAKAYDPTKPYEIDGPVGKIGVVRGHMNLQRLAGKAVATSLSGLSVDQRTYEMTWMAVMLQFVTQSPGYLPPQCNGNIDSFIESIYEFDDLLYYYKEWENWRNSFRAARTVS